MKFIRIFLLILIFVYSCAEEPSHTNIFDPETPNDSPQAVNITPQLVSNISNHSITLGWTESGGEDFSRYQIYRSDQPEVNTQSQLIGDHPYPFWTSVTDSGLAANTAYYYKVYTEDKGGEKTESNQFSVTTSPDIFYGNRMINEGDLGVSFHYSKIAITSDDLNTYLFFAAITKDWDLDLQNKIFPLSDPSYRGDWRLVNSLINGDKDGDGEPDLYELHEQTDPNDPNSFPKTSYTNSSPVSPQQISIFKDTDSDSVTGLILFSTFPSLIIKIRGDLATNVFAVDSSWQDNGMLSLGYSLSMARFSQDQFVISRGNAIHFYSLDGTEQSIVETPLYTAMMAVGEESPNGTKYIYVSNWNGIVYKLDENGNVLNSWTAFQINAGHTSLIGMYADKQDRLFVIDYGLETINLFDGSGQFVSRWYGVNTEFKNHFAFQGSVGIAGHSSISGDDYGNIYIIDQTPYLYHTRIQ